MDFATFQRRAISVPFVIGGRDWSGWDCWGLLYVAHRELFGIEIAKLSDDYDAASTFEEISRIADIERQAEWNEVLNPRPGDVSLFRVSRFQSHVALVVERGQMLHAMRGAGTACERLDTITWAKRHVGYFRNRAHSPATG
jgi:cell wall-associated NlpC family hydrolase